SQRLLDLINVYRIETGVAPLEGVSPALEAAAKGHAHDMTLNDFMGHIGSDGRNPGQRTWDAGYPTTALVGENVAEGYETAFQVMWAWRASTLGHNENMLDPRWKAIGIAREQGSKWRWATDFGTVLDCPSPSSG